MEIINPATVVYIRQLAQKRCELCGRPCRDLEIHHVLKRGMGGGSRIDVPLNLIALGSFWDCCCHHKVENGHISREEVLKAIARRERTPAPLVLAALHAMARLTRDGREPHGEEPRR